MVLGTFGPYTQQYASIISSFQHNAELLDNDHLRADILLHAAAREVAAVDAAGLVVYPTLGVLVSH